jgi:hypothetical protein
MRRWSCIAIFSLVGLFGFSPAVSAVVFHFEALSVDQLSVNVSGQAPGLIAVHSLAVGGQENMRMMSGIVITNEVKDASSLGQAAISIAVHSTLKMRTGAF